MKKTTLCLSLTVSIFSLLLAAPANRNWTLSFSGFGPVKTGMNLKEVERVLGISLKEEDKPADPNECHYAVNNKALPGIAFMLVKQNVVRIDADGKAQRTDLGGKVGMTEAAILKLYPAHEVQRHPYDERGHYIVIKEGTGNYGLIFETDGNVVTSFRSGKYEEVQWPEGCS